MEWAGSGYDYNLQRKPVTQINVNKKIRISLYTLVGYVPAHPHWHAHFAIFRGGKQRAQADRWPGIGHALSNTERLDTFLYTPKHGGIYTIQATLSAASQKKQYATIYVKVKG